MCKTGWMTNNGSPERVNLSVLCHVTWLLKASRSLCVCYCCSQYIHPRSQIFITGVNRTFAIWGTQRQKDNAIERGIRSLSWLLSCGRRDGQTLLGNGIWFWISDCQSQLLRLSPSLFLPRSGTTVTKWNPKRYRTFGCCVAGLFAFVLFMHVARLFSSLLFSSRLPPTFVAASTKSLMFIATAFTRWSPWIHNAVLELLWTSDCSSSTTDRVSNWVSV